MSRYYTEVKPKFYTRLCWTLINHTFFRLLIGIKLYWLRNAILRAFGANIHKRCNIYPSVTIFAPWNLTVGELSTIGPRVNVFNKDLTIIGNHTMISQDSYLCTGSHDISSLKLPVKNKKIIIGDYCWIASNCFIAPGVNVTDGTVLSATSSLFSSTSSWHVYRGNPAVEIKVRNIK